MSIKEGDWLICYTDSSSVGGMGFHQSYFKVGKKYLVSNIDGKLSIFNEYGWYTEVDKSDIVRDYLMTESEWREKQLNTIIEEGDIK